jgi:hypothetical protein
MLSVLRRIFLPKRDRLKGGWRKFHNEELNDLHFSKYNLTVKSMCLRWAGKIRGMHIGFWWEV